ncbi:MAG: aspartate/glutamate racemase family protein [Deltaproteobacteria bacterium]|nr:aspartate/glutamate racemase family protein [Deltaproteobacteria bacterium]MBW2303301.1 aspartate/glutamate racemase family protein [Deltaproteobacteria bacterium]
MKTIGLIGGMSWESSALYYRIINERVREKLGGLHSSRSILYSVDFSEIEELQHSGRWDETTEILAEAAGSLERAGAHFFLICTNTMHIKADEIEARVQIPLLHIADATGERLRAEGLHRVGLLGTRFTMEKDFYRGRLSDRYALDVLIPPEEDREIVHRVIYNELCRGVVNSSSREAYRQIIKGLVRRGAEGIILGCTEIGMLVGQQESLVPVFDTTRIHASAAVDLALDEQQGSSSP